RRQVQLVDRADGVRDRAADQRDHSALAEGVHTEAGQTRNRVGEVDLVLARELAELAVLGEHLPEDRLGLLGAQRLGIGNGLEDAVGPDERTRRHLEVKVRAFCLDYAAEGSLQIEHLHVYRKASASP